MTKPREGPPTRRTPTSTEAAISDQRIDSRIPAANAATSSTSSVRRFPRPQSTVDIVNIGSRVSAHIDSTTTSRPSSPLKRTYSIDENSTDILPSPHSSILAKAYGSILQPKETLATFTCSICATPFPPDATIYPDPLVTDTSTRYLCRPCFIANGGSKGDCESCRRPVLVLKSEGGFIENSGRLWHKRCFRCEACFKDISEQPMVDLLGKPSCADCFDTCLKRDNPKRHDSPILDRDEKKSNLGGMKGTSRSRQGSPALEELEQRLGTLSRSRETTPIMEHKARTLPPRGVSSPSRDSPTRSPLSMRYTSPVRDESPITDRIRLRGSPEVGTPTPPARPGDGSPPRRNYDKLKNTDAGEVNSSLEYVDSPTTSPRPARDEAIQEMKKRFLNSAKSSPSSSPKPMSPPSKESPRTPQSRIPVPVRKSLSPNLRSVASTSSLSSENQFLSFADPSSSSVTPIRTRSSVSCLRPNVDTLSSELLSTPDLTKHIIPTPSLRSITSIGSLRQEHDLLLSTPELGSDFSDSTSVSHSPGPSTPPSLSPPSHQPQTIYSKVTERDSVILSTTPTPKSTRHSTGIVIPTSISPSAKCAKCNGSLLTTTHGGKFVTVPDESLPPKMYHTRCFCCSVCGGVFEDNKGGKAVYVKSEVGICHVHCAPKEKFTRRFQPSSSATRLSTSSVASSGRYGPPPPTATATSFPKFGGRTACPGCHQSVSPMERGVVPGPAGTRWHSICLVCGGKNKRARAGRRVNDEPGCGKKLDSAARTDGDGGVWCRECLVGCFVVSRDHSRLMTRSTAFATSTVSYAIPSYALTHRIHLGRTGC
jgi:LIM domain